MAWRAEPRPAGATPVAIGLNVGHRFPGSNWAMWLRRLGVNSARVFLPTTGGQQLAGWVGAENWGQSLGGEVVGNRTAFDAAVAVLRTPAGHNPALAYTFANPVEWDWLDTLVRAACAGEAPGCAWGGGAQGGRHHTTAGAADFA